MTDAPAMNTGEILDGIRQWVEIESPTDDAQAVNRMMSRVQADYEALGAKTERIAGTKGFGDCLRVRSPWGGDGPGILVLNHLDTVHPLGTLAGMPFKVDGDHAYGPGIFDMKGGAFLGFHAFRSFVRAGRETPLPITFLYNSEEEVSSPISRPIIEEAARQARYVLVAEPSLDLEKVVTSRKGTARFNVTITGRAAHSGSKHAEGRSAIKELARQILVLEDMTDYERNLTLNVGTISGGTRANVVPSEAHAFVDMRVPTRAIADEAIAKVLALKAFDPDVTVDVDGGAKRPPFERTEKSANLFETARNLAGEIGFNLGEMMAGGASDGNFTAPIVPTLDGLGVVGEGAHTDWERIHVPQLEKRATLMFRLLETLS
jgi:glutamate carboxypeptidase